MPEMAKSSEIKLFADDSLLFRTINNQADSVLLQNDLTSLQNWEDKWQMSFNAKKCQVIRITPKNRPPLPTTYKLHGHTLDTVYASKYLGVTISNNLVGLTMDVYAADFTGLVQSFKLRLINPNVLLSLPIVLSMCLSQVRLLEMVTPRYLLASTVSNVCPCSL
jgi:hypothetical protein